MLQVPAQRVSATSSNTSSTVEPVRIFLRIRPPLPYEDPDDMCLKLPADTENQVQLINCRNTRECFLYQFDRCFGPNAAQSDIFQAVLPLLDSVLQTGRNGTILAYGITGAGKTFTMDGYTAKVQDSAKQTALVSEQQGIIPRAVRHLFRQMALLEKKPEYQRLGTKFTLKFSHLEVYNEKVFDLMATDRQDLPLRQDADGNIVVAGLAEHTIKCFEDFEKYYAKSRDNRSTAATKLNALSSRSHSVLRLSITREQNGRQRNMKLHLIDLAGSEDNRKTGNDKERMIESGNINKSLFMLSQVVESLNNNATNIPYRNSKLTRLLQDSLGGKSMALMITNVAAGSQFYLDTANTLNMARRTRQIVNHTETSREIDTQPHVRSLSAITATKSGLSSVPLKRSSTDSTLSSTSIRRISADGEKSTVLKPIAKQPLGAPLREKIPTSRTSNPSTQSQPLKSVKNPRVKDAPTVNPSSSAAPPVSIPPASMDWGNVFSMATPNTKRGLARACIVAAKEQRTKGDLTGALQQYQKAAELQPSQKLVTMITEIRAELNGEDVSSPVIRPPVHTKQPKEGKRPLVTDDIHSSTTNLDESLSINRDSISSNASSNKRLKTSGRALMQILDSPDASSISISTTHLTENQPIPLNNVSTTNAGSKPPSLKDNLEDQAIRRLLTILNSGDVKLIRSIRGLGEKRAKHIVEYQQIYGPYQSMNQLKLAGLGDKLIQNIRNDFLVTVLADVN